MADDFNKLAGVIGARNSTVDGGKGLTRAASWIEGILGPSNTGYAVQKFNGPETGGQPILRIDLQGSEEKAPPLWIVSAYDSPIDEKGIAEASSAVVAMVAAAQAVAGDKPMRPIRFVFLPHGHETSQSVSTTEARFMKMVSEEAKAHSILCLGNLRGSGGLALASGDSSNPALAALSALGTVLPVEKANGTLAARLFSSGLPAVSLTADPAEPVAAGATESELLATSTGRFVELIRRLMVGK
ncbi:MAG: hypothetical protein CFE26_07685 [Verrucomicrobiales bacterium VVV1]|nr:MAG: hypothetical protein CFE26_07685 [Verrucomicrobiales bacterium VVV1]